MKKFNYSRILILVLSLALLIGAAFAVTANAEEAVETPATLFKGISVAYGDNVAISVAVDAELADLNDGTVKVKYSIDNAEYDATDFFEYNGLVWARTKGIEAYNLAKVVTFSSYLGETQVDSGKTYSVAQFLYTMLYTEGLSEVEENLYNALLTYGEATQKWYNAKNDPDLPLVTASSLVYTNNENVKVNGNGKAFAPAAGVEVALTYNNTPADHVVHSWKVKVNGNEQVIAHAELLTLPGVVEVVEPIFYTAKNDLANGGFEKGLEGWTVVGNIGGISSDKNYWVNDPESAEGFAFGMDGDKMFSCYAPGAAEDAVGTLTSSSFIVGGSGFVTFKIGGLKNQTQVYLDVVDAETNTVLVRYYNGLWADRTNNVKSGCALTAYKADLSAFMGKSVFFRISDYASADYGLIFADSFVTYYDSEPTVGFHDATEAVINGSFENGMEGWTMNITDGGEHNTLGWVLDKEVDSQWYSKNDGKIDGSNLFTFWHNDGRNCENSKGTLTSSTFTLKQGAFVSFKFGGAGGAVNHDVWIELCRADGTVIEKFYNDFGGKVHTVMNSYFYQYTGETTECFFRVVDNSTSDYGCFVVDAFQVNLTSAPVGYHEAIR